jgi:RNase H-fold protein (predicted Holliday junction resolvase)
MPATIEGVQVSVLVDLDDTTLVLGRDHLGDVMNGWLENAADVSCDVVSASWSWGAGSYRRLLTECETGQLELDLDDPTRAYDPANDQGPYFGALRRDRPIRVLVAADVDTPEGPVRQELVAWTGKVRTWAHDWAGATTHATAYDVLEEATRQPVSFTAPAATPTAQAQAVAAAVGFPMAVHSGYRNLTRSSHRFASNLREALADCRLADLGHVWADRRGRLQYADRSRAGHSALPYLDPIVVGCDPVPVGNLTSSLDRSELVNVVRVDRFDPSGSGLDPYVYRLDASVVLNGEHALLTSEQELDLEADTDSPSNPYQGWSSRVLAAMGSPEDEVKITGVQAEGLHALALLGSDYLAPIWLRLPGYFGRRLLLVGLRVALTPDGWTFDLVTGREPGTPPNTEAPPDA